MTYEFTSCLHNVLQVQIFHAVLQRLRIVNWTVQSFGQVLGHFNYFVVGWPFRVGRTTVDDYLVEETTAVLWKCVHWSWGGACWLSPECDPIRVTTETFNVFFNPDKSLTLVPQTKIALYSVAIGEEAWKFRVFQFADQFFNFYVNAQTTHAVPNLIGARSPNATNVFYACT